MRPLLTALVAACVSTAAIAQTPASNKRSAQAKPKEPIGCKLVGTIRGTKLWAGNCVAPSELRGAMPAEAPSQEETTGAIPPAEKQ